MDQLWLFAALTLFTMALAHVSLWPGVYRKKPVQPIASYVIGVGIIGLYLTLYLAINDNTEGIFAFWALVLCGAIPPVVLRWIRMLTDEHAELRLRRLHDSTDEGE